MKKTLLTVTIVSLLLMPVFTQSVFAQQNTGPAAIILNHYSPRNFAAGAITPADLDLIVLAGIRAPSAGNRQPWHFTVVQNQNLTKQLISIYIKPMPSFSVKKKGIAAVAAAECTLRTLM